MDTILVVNAGSSSVKFQVFERDGASKLKRLIKGQVDGIGTRPHLRARSSDGSALVDQALSTEVVSDVPAALRRAGDWLREQQGIKPFAVGHRVVHGGPDYDRPILIDDDVVARLERYIPLAPLHQPNNLAPIRSIRAQMPELPQVACFDTAFHRGHSAVADHYAIPERLYAEGVRRYGFHGLSYEYIASQLPTIAPAARRVIVAHLGSGASMCALDGGRSVESTLGFTALDGLPMGTRPGQLDPGVALYLVDQKGMSTAEIQHLFYHECGLKGISGVSNDMRELMESKNPRATFAIDYFVHRAGLYAGMLAAALGGVDAFVFTAGIGENASDIRARIVRKLAWLGAVLDPVANAVHARLISQTNSRVGLYVVPTDEVAMIARHTLSLLPGRHEPQAVGKEDAHVPRRVARGVSGR
jgi:acetate kinase